LKLLHDQLAHQGCINVVQNTVKMLILYMHVHASSLATEWYSRNQSAVLNREWCDSKQVELKG